MRFNDDFIQRIRSMTYEKEIHHPKTKRRNAFSFKKKCKIIGSGPRHPYYNIGHSLYAKHEWHGDGRNRTPHKPFITIDQFLTVHELTKIPLAEMEQNVIEIRAGHNSRLDIPMKFPVEANEKWAWLFGIWFSAGGLTTRARKSKGKSGGFTEERAIRIRVTEQVYNKKLAPLLREIAYVPKLTAVWYAKKGMKHPLDKERRPGVGGRPKKVVFLARPVREIMEKFGLPIHVSQPLQGGKYACRKFNMTIPKWISSSATNLDAFIEGYINGAGMASLFRYADYGGHPAVVRWAEIRFSGIHEEQVEKFYKIFAEHLTKKGIYGYRHELTCRYATYWLGYAIHHSASLYTFFEAYDIQNPPARARLMLHYFMNDLLLQACKELTSSEILILGSLIEEPKTVSQITREMRFNPKTAETALKKLKKLRIAKQANQQWTLDPTSYRDNLIQKLHKKEEKRRAFLTTNHSSFFYKCDKCGTIIARKYLEDCGCGGTYKPVPRMQVLKFYRGRNNWLINRISEQEIPSA